MGNIGYKKEIIITDVWEREGGREGMVGQVTQIFSVGIKGKSPGTQWMWVMMF